MTSSSFSLTSTGGSQPSVRPNRVSGDILEVPKKRPRIRSIRTLALPPSRTRP